MAQANRGYIRDMTKGNVFRHILIFAIPLLIGDIFQEIYTMVDTMVAGRVLGDAAIAAIGSSGSLYSLITKIAIGMNGGCAIVITRSFGAHDPERIRSSVAGTFEVNLLLSLFLSALSLFILRPVLHALNVPESLMEQTYIYSFILLAGILTTVAYNTFAAILRAFGNSRTALIFLIVSSMSNVVLDILMVAVLKMGVAGAAYATVIAQALSAVLSGLYVILKYKDYMPKKADWKVPLVMMRELITTGLSMSAMLTIVALGSIMSAGALNKLGETIITAKTSAMKWLMILTMPLGAMSSVGSTFTGQNYGAGQKARVKEGLRLVMIIAAVWSILSTLLVYLAGRQLIQFTTGSTDGEMLGYATLELKIMMPFTLFEGGLLVMRSSMQAMGEKLAPIIASTIEMAYNLLSAFVIIPLFGFLGACFNGPVVWTVCMVFVGIVYLVKRKRWLGEAPLPQA